MSKKHIIPRHVGIIMDGNRRWARLKGLPIMAGHEQGYAQVINIVDHALMRGVKYLTVWAFSTENWKRSPAEVAYLMKLVLKMFREQLEPLHKKGVRIRILGTKRRLSPEVKRAIEKTEETTKKNSKFFLQIAFNYGGRYELKEAIQRLVDTERIGVPITEKLISKYVYYPEIPDMDLMI